MSSCLWPMVRVTVSGESPAVPGVDSPVTPHARQLQYRSAVAGLCRVRNEVGQQHFLPEGHVQLFSVGPKRSKGEQVKSLFSPVQRCQFWSLHMPPFRLSPLLPNTVWQAPGTSLLQDKGESSEEKWVPWARTRGPLEPTAISLVCKGQGPRPLGQGDPIVSEIHLTLWGLSVAI